MGVFLIVIMGLFVFSLITGFLGKNVVMVLTEENVWLDNFPPIGFIGTIDWEEIYDIQIETNQDEKAILFYYDSENKKHSRKRRLSAFNLEDRDIARLALLFIEEDREEVIKTVFEYWQEYQQRADKSLKIFEQKDIIVKEQKNIISEIKKDNSQLVRGLLKAADSKKQIDLKESIEIKRNEETFFEFHICSLDKKEMDNLSKKYVTEKLVLQKIYLATIDREKIWDNEEIQNQLRTKGFSICTGVDVIQAVLEESEIKEINARIDQISGFHDAEISNVN